MAANCGGGGMAGAAEKAPATAGAPVPNMVWGWTALFGLFAASSRSACEPWRSVFESRLKA